MIEKLKRGVSAVRARNSTFPSTCPSPGWTTTGPEPMRGIVWKARAEPKSRTEEAMMVTEARLEDVGSGLAPVSPGWFVVNVGEAAWVRNDSFGGRCVFES